MSEEGYEEGYNGWENYPTWCIHLHLSNDHQGYLYWVEAARKAKAAAQADPDQYNHGAANLARWSLADRLWEELTDPEYGWVPSLGSQNAAALLGWDLLEWAIRQADWREIAEAFLEAAGEDEATYPEDAFPIEYYDPEDEGEDN